MTTLATTYEVRARRRVDGNPGKSGSTQQAVQVERTTARYAVADAAAALAAFAVDRPDICTSEANRQGWHLVCVIPGAGERPARRLMNWERDPDAEVSDGWLSNIAAAGNNLADRLLWEPEFCTKAHRHVPCPACGEPLGDFWGKWGGFYRCPTCGWKAGITTKKARAAEARTRLTGWCGTPLEVRYNRNGVPYAGCSSCDPAHRSPTVNDLSRWR